MNMKKMLGILLALCFVVSVTAGAAAAAPGYGQKDKKHDEKCFKKVWVKGHVEFKKVTKVIEKHHKKIIVTKIVKKWVPGHWKIVKVHLQTPRQPRPQIIWQ